MPIAVVCPSCGNNISAPDHVAGRTLRCYKCLNPFTVPNVQGTPAPMAPLAQLAPSMSAPVAAVMPPPVPVAASSGPDPFELNQEPNWDAAIPPAPNEELPSTQDVPMEEGAMELSSTDEYEVADEPAMEEGSEEPVGPRKSRWLAFFLAVFFGGLSIHRFYLGYRVSAILQIILVMFVIGIPWLLIDILRLLLGKFKDARGVPVG